MSHEIGVPWKIKVKDGDLEIEVRVLPVNVLRFAYKYF